MIKRWYVVCQVNMCANQQVSLIINANTARKARIFAEKECYKAAIFM